MKDLYSGLKITSLMVQAVTNSDADSDTIDMQGYESLMFVVDMGLSADTLNGSNTIELEVEDSPNDSDWTDCDNADISKYVTGTNTGTFALINAASEDETNYITGYKGDKRYVHVTLNFTGTHSTGTPIGILAIQSNPRSAPVNAST